MPTTITTTAFAAAIPTEEGAFATTSVTAATTIAATSAARP